MDTIFSSISSFVIAGALLVSSLLLLVVTARQVSLRGAVLLRRAKEKAQDLIADATKRSNALLEEAQQKSVAEFSIQQARVTEAADRQIQQLQGTAETLRQTIESQQARVAEVADQQMQQLQGTAATLQQTIEAQMKEIQGVVQNVGATMNERLEKTLQEYDQKASADHEAIMSRWEVKIEETLVPLRSQLQEQLQSDIAEARTIVEAYKEQQRLLLDNHAVGILEQAFTAVMGEKISLAEHSEFIQSALEKAKTDGVFK